MPTEERPLKKVQFVTLYILLRPGTTHKEVNKALNDRSYLPYNQVTVPKHRNWQQVPASPFNIKARGLILTKDGAQYIKKKGLLDRRHQVADFVDSL